MRLPKFSVGERVGGLALLTAGALWPAHSFLAVVPLGLFLLMCLAAPFIPATSFFLPVVTRGRKDRRAIALTFDDGPDPAATPSLLALLSEYRVPATFFLTGERAACFPEIVRRIVAGGHTIGNHTYRHDNLIMLKTERAVREEIAAAQQVFARFGVRPRVFRPPVGITGPRLWKPLRQAGLVAVNFSLRACDRGNRRIDHISERILRKLRAGDIIMLHDIRPRRGNSLDRWLLEVRRVVEGADAKGFEIVTLSDVIGGPVMERVPCRP